MPSFMITFRSHPNEPSLLDTFLTLFFASDLFLTASEYKYNIEKDGTPDRHFHIFLTTAMLRDSEKVYKFLSKREFEQFKEWLVKKDTELTPGLHCLLVSDRTYKRNDRLYRIGYVSKDRPSPWKDLLTSNLDQALIKQGLEYMVEWNRINIQEPDYSKDIKNLTMKTVLPQVIYFHEEKNFPLDELIFDRMAKEGVFSIAITNSQEEKIIRQLRIYYGYKEIKNKKPYDSTIKSEQTFSEFTETIHKIDSGYTTIDNEKKCNKCLGTFPCSKHPLKTGD